MWDGRETFAGADDQASTSCDRRTAPPLGHAQAAAAADGDAQTAIVDFETALFTAQHDDNAAGGLDGERGHGGPPICRRRRSTRHQRRARRRSAPGAPPFTPSVDSRSTTAGSGSVGKTNGTDGARGAIARGEDAVQHQADRHHRRRRAQRRRSAVAGHRRHLHDLPRHAERRQPLGGAAARHRHHRRARAARPTCRSTRCAT